VEKISDHGVSAENIFPRKKKKDNCNNLIDKRRNLEEHFLPVERMLHVLYCRCDLRNAIISASILMY
jgi:hypothetical protein